MEKLTTRKFYKICVFGIDRRRIYHRVQRSKNLALKRFLGRDIWPTIYTRVTRVSAYNFQGTEHFVRT